MAAIGDLSNLPPAARALVHASQHSFITADRGHVRANNDATADARARHFAGWLEAADFTVDTFSDLEPADFPSVLGACLNAVADGDNCQDKKNLTSKTLNGCLSAASTAITFLTNKPCSYHDPVALGNKRPKTLPMIAEIMRQRSSWRVPLPRKEPFTIAMTDSLRNWLHIQSHSSSISVTFLIEEHAVCDWVRLGVFTGSRVSQHGQTASHRSTLPGSYARTPVSRDAGVWSGQALAFIKDDFTFCSSSFHLLDHKFCLLNATLNHVFEVHIRFRFDKSKDDFTIRKFRRIPNAPFDPIIATINIIRRAHILAIPAHEPLGQCRHPSRSVNSLLFDRHVRDTMRMACKLAYPDPTHCCRIHVLGLVAHSNRVTAALCLKLGGASNEDIAFRLRWHLLSVPTYLRECFNGIDETMMQAIQGAIKTF
jgi:hypothetical protein